MTSLAKPREHKNSSRDQPGGRERKNKTFGSTDLSGEEVRRLRRAKGGRTWNERQQTLSVGNVTSSSQKGT